MRPNPHQAQGLSRDLEAPRAQLPHRPVPGAEARLRLPQALVEGQQEQKGVLGDAGGRPLRGQGHADPPGPAGRHVDVVVADALVLHVAQAGRRRQKRGVDAGRGHDDELGPGQAPAQLVRRPALHHLQGPPGGHFRPHERLQVRRQGLGVEHHAHRG